MTVLVRRMILLAGLGALTAVAVMPRAAAQTGSGAPAAGQAAPKGSATPFPGGSAPKSASPANVSPAGPARVATINSQEAMTGTQEGKKEFDALQKKFAPQKTALEGMNTDIEKMKSDLAAAQSLSADDRAKREKLIEQKTADLQGRFEAAQRSYQLAEQDVMKRMGPKMMTVVESYAKSKGFDMVVDIGNPQTPVVWAGDRLNITKAVIEAYDKANPSK